jgi:protein-disulfide isomerase
LVLCAVVMTGLVAYRTFGRTADVPTAATFARTRVRDSGEPPSAGQPMGGQSAPITLVLFSDFQCQYCRKMDETLRELRRRYPGKVSVLFRHYPLPFHPEAIPAAIAAECAGDQNKFDRFAEIAFTNQDSIGILSWRELAGRAGVVDLPRFEKCRESGQVNGRIKRDGELGSRLRIRGTPALVLGHEMVSGAMSLDSLNAWIGSSSWRK